jgi:hypothetical protein
MINWKYDIVIYCRYAVKLSGYLRTLAIRRIESPVLSRERAEFRGLLLVSREGLHVAVVLLFLSNGFLLGSIRGRGGIGQRGPTRPLPPRAESMALLISVPAVPAAAEMATASAPGLSVVARP